MRASKWGPENWFEVERRGGAVGGRKAAGQPQSPDLGHFNNNDNKFIWDLNRPPALSHRPQHDGGSDGVWKIVEKNQRRRMQILEKPTTDSTKEINPATRSQWASCGLGTTELGLGQSRTLCCCDKSHRQQPVARTSYCRSVHWLTLMTSVLILNLPNQFGAQTLANNNNDVIFKLSTPSTNVTAITVAPDRDAQQQQQKQQQQLDSQQHLLLGHRFKYHLNHLRPPSLVPITIQQADSSPKNPSLSLMEPSSNKNGQQNGWPTLGAATNRRPATDNGTTSRRPHHLERHQRALGQEAEQLVQLQLPLQLHLKLRPLPLPMPPPPPTARRNNHPASADNLDPQDDATEKRKRSLEPPVSTTTASPPSGRAELQQVAARNDLLTLAWREARRVLVLNSMSPSQTKPERRTADLIESDSAIDTSSQSRRRRRQELLPFNKWKSPEPPMKPPQNVAHETPNPTSPKAAAKESSNQGTQAEPMVTAPHKLGSTETAQHGAEKQDSFQEQQLPAKWAAGEPNDPKDEVRRQRHSSQQQLQGQPTTNNQPTELVMDARIQAMAAAMLPLVWPSFQLTGGQRHRWPNQWAAPAAQSATMDAHAQLGGPDRLPVQTTTTGWPMKYTQLARADKQQQLENGTDSGPAAATSRAGHIIESPNSLEPPTQQPDIRTAATILADAILGPSVAKGRSKRRKPGYLSQAYASSTPYPDSTRLANKYPMPKIKFRALEQQQLANLQQQSKGSNQEHHATVGLNEAKKSLSLDDGGGLPRPAPGGASKKKQQVYITPNLPKSLSKLIEQQLLANATNLLLYHKSHNQGMPPTTSISKVVRLMNNTITNSNSSITGARQIVNVTSSTTRQPVVAPARDPITSMKRHSPTRVQSYSLTTASSNMAPTVLPPLATPMSTSVSVSSSTSTTITTTTTSRPPASAKQPKANLNGSKQQQAPAIITTTSESTITTTIISTTTTPAPRGSKKNEHLAKPLLARKRQPTRNQALDDKALGSNKILPEYEEHSPASGNMSDFAHGGTPLARKHHQAAAARASGIKLFHFKRKPDMNKLPFYKKPLNYTELGWSLEQILEHQEASRRAAEAAGESDESLPVFLLNSTNSLNGERQKRKRRGKNHFERLMGELHGNSAQAASGKQPSEDEDEPEEGQEDSTEAAVAEERPLNEVAASEERVPVMRKKTEPLVLRPMFSVMKQKRRVASAAGNASLSMDATPSLAPQVSGGAEETPSVAQNVSRPVVRLRRKHHGEQPSAASHQLASMQMSSDPDQAPWRPSKPLWSPGAGERLLLVPSGILTPSGHHLIPLLTNNRQLESAEDRNRLAMELLSWRPARQQPVVGSSSTISSQLAPQWLHGTDVAKPSDGLAPSGEENFLRAPGDDLLAGQKETAGPDSSSEKRQPSSATILQQSSSANSSSELRVPRLLIKPMRPAKYSLNGYIPKPSLGQQLQQQVPAPAKAQWPPSTRRPAAVGGALTANGKDLDSSTSNEVFSRRRGLQQHRRSAQAKSQLSFNGLLGSEDSPKHPAGGQEAAAAAAAAAGKLSAHLKQLEENKRKYIVQPAKSPTLTAQKANLIKAKLGLIVTPSTNSSSGSKSSAQLDATIGTSPVGEPSAAAHSLKQATNANAIVTGKAKGPPGELSSGSDQVPIAGATPLSTIPKTDFECTDKKGRFVAGLFADHKTGCQVWHLCANNRKYSFLCPSGTIFSAKLRICDWKYNAKCENSLPH